MRRPRAPGRSPALSWRARPPAQARTRRWRAATRQPSRAPPRGRIAGPPGPCARSAPRGGAGPVASKSIHGSAANTASTPVRSRGGLLPSFTISSIPLSVGAETGMRSSAAASLPRTVRRNVAEPSTAGATSPSETAPRSRARP